MQLRSNVLIFSLMEVAIMKSFRFLPVYPVLFYILFLCHGYDINAARVYDQEKGMPGFDDVRVSSTLSSKTGKYIAPHLIDGSSRSWVEGVKGPGVGESIFIDFKAPVKVSYFYIKNGFGDPKWYGANHRVKELQVESTGRISDNFDKKTFTVTLKDTGNMQEIHLPEKVLCRGFKFTIKSVYRGSKFDDTCISEISFKPLKVGASPQWSYQDPSCKGPVSLNIMGYELLLRPNGKMTGKGAGMCQCECPFVRGTWGPTSDGGYYLYIVNKIDSNCGDVEAEPSGVWVENYMVELIDRVVP